MQIQFLGGVETVTGTKYLIESNGVRVLRDFGLFQGRRKEARAINERMPVDADSIDALVLSHAHIDHCGAIPLLAQHGFDGPIYATRVTRELCEVMLRDAAKIQEQDAAYLNQKTSRKGYQPVVPLYTQADAEAALALFRGTGYETITLGDGMQVSFMEAGHILGSALNVFTLQEGGRQRRVGVAVDLGRPGLPIVRPPEVMQDIDLLILESTYGDRQHADVSGADEQLRVVVQRTLDRGGKVFIPSFALERAQEVILHLARLFGEGRLPEVPVYVDSPMADAITHIFKDSVQYMNEAFHALRAQVGDVMRPPWVTFTSSVEESKRVTASKEPCIVIAASGMCEYGRILHHLKHGIENPANTVVLVGFQAAHTLGRRLVEQQDEVRIFGDIYTRRAEVEVLNAFSAHADRDDLMAYVEAVRPRAVCLAHGEETQRQALAERLRATDWVDEVLTPKTDEVYAFDD
jgi:metallo-beta-lactamase family protein